MLHAARSRAAPLRHRVRAEPLRRRASGAAAPARPACCLHSRRRALSTAPAPRPLGSAERAAKLAEGPGLASFLPSAPGADVLTDKFGRDHSYLRISLTEKCSLRCQYCMPADGVPLQPKDDILSTDEVVQLAELFVRAGITKIRLTGGEPLVHPDIVQICERIGALPGLEDLAITTNGLVLEKRLQQLQDAGVNQLNVSLDTLVASKFRFITRRKGFERVVSAVEAAVAAGYHHAGSSTIKVNVCVMNGFNEDEIADFVGWTKDMPVDVRFIEWMPFGGNEWNDEKFFSYSDMLAEIRGVYPGFTKHIDGPNDTAKHWHVPGFAGRVGFITSMTEHFCGTCNRLRITADGVCTPLAAAEGRDTCCRRPVLRSQPNGASADTGSALLCREPEGVPLRQRRGQPQRYHAVGRIDGTGLRAD